MQVGKAGRGNLEKDRGRRRGLRVYDREMGGGGGEAMMR